MPPSPSPHHGDAREVPRQWNLLTWCYLIISMAFCKLKKECFLAVASRCQALSSGHCESASLFTSSLFRAFSGNSIPWDQEPDMNSACLCHGLHYSTSTSCLPQSPVLNSEVSADQDLHHNNINPYFQCCVESQDRKQEGLSHQCHLPSTVGAWSGPAFILGISSISVKVSDMSPYKTLIPKHSTSKRAGHAALASC